MCLTGSAPALAQQIRHLDPEPNSIEHGYIEYVGNFGEVLTVPDSWNIRGAMHGVVEVVNISPRRQPFAVEEADAKDSDFAAENFSRFHLIQLIVMPRAQSSFKTMEDLQAAKIADLDKIHAGYVVHDPPFFGGWSGSWPAGSFEIWVSTPYRLSQLYVATEEYLCILTSGRDIPPAYFIASGYDGVRSGVRNWIVPESDLRRAQELAEIHGDRREAILKSGVSFAPLKSARVWVVWLATVLSGFIFFAIGVRGGLPSIRRLGIALLVFPQVGALIGTVIGFIFWGNPWASHRLPWIPAIAMLPLPLVMWALRRIFDLQLRAIVAVSVWAGTCAVVLVSMTIGNDWGASWHRFIPFLSGTAAFFCYGAAGLIWSIFTQDCRVPPHAGLAGLIAVAILFGDSNASAQPIIVGKPTPATIEGDAEFEARRRLAARGESVSMQREEAIATLREMGRPIYRYQRVEISGIWSRDDTNVPLPDVFDHQVKPSQVDKNIGVRGPLSELAARYARDLSSLSLDERHGVSAAARQAVTDLQDPNGNPVEVNEIVAHSWGTVIAYNAILSGAIKPPKKLIVAGMPDMDLEKWKALAKFTGTEVIVYADPHDPPARTARIIGNLKSYISDKLRISNPTNPFEAEWADACRQRVCNEHFRAVSPPRFDFGYQGASHSRLEYYRAMMRNGDLDRNVEELKAGQEEDIRFESERLFQVLVAREKAVVEREQQSRSARLASDRELRETLGQIAQRACDDPGSVEQDELDALPRPNPGFDAWPSPSGLHGCAYDLYVNMYFALKDAPLKAGSVRDHFRPRAAPAVAAPPPAALPEYNQNWAVPILISKACDDPASLDQKTFEYYLRSGVIRTQEVGECRRPVSARSGCYGALLRRICSAGNEVPMSLEYLLSLARFERQQSSVPPASPIDPGDVETDRHPKGSSGDNCVRTYIPELGQSIRACP